MKLAVYPTVALHFFTLAPYSCSSCIALQCIALTPDTCHFVHSPDVRDLLQSEGDIAPLFFPLCYTASTILTYIHAYIHTYIHTYLRTYIHTYMHTYIQTARQTNGHTCVGIHADMTIQANMHTSI